MPWPVFQTNGVSHGHDQSNMRSSRVTPSETLLDISANKKAMKMKTNAFVGLRRRGSGSSGNSSTFGSHLMKKKKTDISRNFSQKECFKYIEKSEGSSGEKKCACGLMKLKHPGDVVTVSDKQIKWSTEKCTRRVPTDTYGEIQFSEDRGSVKPYIRIADDTSGLQLLRLLRQKWELEVPNLVISVTGGAKSFHLRPRLKAAFDKGMIKVAVSTGAWIITGGTNAGVMKHVGEAVKNRASVSNMGRSKINVIGIAPWGVLESNHLLVSKDGAGKYPADYNYCMFDPSCTGLDVNHSHFLLVDNGTVGQYGTEIELRSRVEGAIAKYLKTNSNAATGTIGIPVVILCLEGGPNTIKTMAEAIKKGTPAVVIDGSGRSADIVCYAYKHLIYDEASDRSVIDPQYVTEIQRKVSEVFGKKNMLSVYAEIEEMLKDEKMVTVFRLDDEGGQCDIDLAILRALLKANKASFQTQLKLALAWNRIDIARSEIFTEDLKEDNFKVEWLYESMFTALLDNKPDFVELFLNEGVNLKHFLTLDILLNLYNGIPRSSAIRQVINNQLSRLEYSVTDMNAIGIVIEDLMGDRFKSRYRTDPSYAMSAHPGNEQKKDSSQKFFNENETVLPTPHLDLFIWAVLLNRQALAHMLWERTRDSIACALMASKLLKSLAEKITDNKELADMVDDLNRNSKAYEAVAVGVLDECRNDNEEFAQTLLVKELPDFGYLTSLDIAVSADNQDFIAHISCQTLLSRLWMGALYINSSLWKVLPCILLPFLINIMVSFREDMQKDDNTEVNVNKSIDDDGFDNNVTNDSMLFNNSEFSLRNASDLENDHFELEEKKEMTHTVLDHFDDVPEDLMFRKAHTGYLHRIVHFYEAPFVKFSVNVLSYTSFLMLYAFVILSHFQMEVHFAEYILQIWVFTLICEEVRQLLTQEPKAFSAKVVSYCSDPWNIADIISLFSFVLATIFRYIAFKTDVYNYLVVARIMYATDIVIFIVRLLQIFSVNRHMGPKLVMIRKMLDDLVYFVVILGVFIIGYGVAKQAVVHPNTDLWSAVVGVFNHPYWQMYGELFIDDIFEDRLNCTTGQPLCMQEDADNPCLDKHGLYVLPIYMGVYMLFTNILLLNLLIAIFNYTFDKIQEDSDKVWKFQRFYLISEYHDRPAFCPPFIMVSHIILCFKWLARLCHCCGRSAPKGSSMRVQLLQEEMERFYLWEYVAAEAYCYHSTVKEAETQDERVKSILSRVNILSEEVAVIKDGEGERREGGRTDARVARRSTVNSTIETRLAKLEYNMEHILELLIQQNQKQAVILDASQHIMSNNSHSNGLSTVKSKVTSIHTKARISPYPGSMVKRFKIPDEKVPWEVPFEEYEPLKYTATVVLNQPYWADLNILKMEPRPTLFFNAYDEEHKVNRISHLGSYDVVDGLPSNPCGRTGIIGRGYLGRFGPNHAADPIATRWKRTSSGIMLDKGKRVLEFIAIQRRDNHQWAIPGGMVEPGEHVSETLRKEFTEEALAKLELSAEKRKQLSERVSYLFRNGVEVYKGYVDDPRNTDHAWMETVACNFHDDSGEVFGEFQLQAGDDAQAVRWQRVSGNIPLFASHVGILEKVAKMHSAAFY